MSVVSQFTQFRENSADYSLFHFCSQIGPIIALGSYSILEQKNDRPPLDESTAFAALSVLSLLDGPFSDLLSAVEHFQTLSDCFGRVQSQIRKQETRQPQTPNVDDMDCMTSRAATYCEFGIEKEQKKNSHEQQQTDHPLEFVASLKNANIHSVSKDSVIVHNITLDFPKGQITMITGPVGCGKSTLLKALIGEAEISQDSFFSTWSTAAYCPQSPWITRGTIRDNIVGMSTWDPVWYQTVTYACDLVKDLEYLPDGDLTLTGNRGNNLSGGQQTRVVSMIILKVLSIKDYSEPGSSSVLSQSRSCPRRCSKGLGSCY